MKKQNKTYLPLDKQGIKKSWDKIVIFNYYNGLKMVVYYQNKPFYFWYVEDAFDVEAVRRSLICMLETYNSATLNQRKIKKSIARYFVRFEAGERVATYRRGGVLFPSNVGV